MEKGKIYRFNLTFLFLAVICNQMSFTLHITQPPYDSYNLLCVCSVLQFRQIYLPESLTVAELTAVPIPPSLRKSSLSVDQVSYRSGLALFHYWALAAAAAVVFLLALLYFTYNQGGSSHTGRRSSHGADL